MAFTVCPHQIPTGRERAQVQGLEKPEKKFCAETVSS